MANSRVTIPDGGHGDVLDCYDLIINTCMLQILHANGYDKCGQTKVELTVMYVFYYYLSSLFQ